jgi:CarD family transcriptional regulator
MSFRRGDVVVYPKYGLGKVVKAEERPVFGRTQRCLEIRFLRDNRTVFIHEEDFHKVHLRGVMGPKMVTSVYKVLREPPQYAQVRTADRRLERYRSKAAIGDPVSLAEVARDLVRRGQRHRLNDIEQELANSAVGLLTAELAHVENVEPAAVRTKLTRILER